MQYILLKSKIHHAVVTDADPEYEGSISIDPKLCQQARLHLYEKVDVYNITNGERFSTYVIHGKKGEICLNGAAAWLGQKGDRLIIACYAHYSEEEVKTHQPILVYVNSRNRITAVKRS